MDHLSSRGHSVTAEINAPCTEVFEFLQEPMNLGKWALGCWDTRPTDEPGLYTGTSLFSGDKSFFRLSANKDLYLIDYLVGERDKLVPRISIRVIAGETVGSNDSCCLVTVDAWRDIAMNDERWRQLCISHETEILLIKALIEREI